MSSHRRDKWLSCVWICPKFDNRTNCSREVSCSKEQLQRVDYRLLLVVHQQQIEQSCWNISYVCTHRFSWLLQYYYGRRQCFWILEKDLKVWPSTRRELLNRNVHSQKETFSFFSQVKNQKTEVFSTENLSWHDFSLKNLIWKAPTTHNPLFPECCNLLFSCTLLSTQISLASCFPFQYLLLTAMGFSA